MHSARPRSPRALLAQTVSLVLGVCLSLGLVLALAWVGAWTADDAASHRRVEYGGRTAVSHARATRAVTLGRPTGTRVGDVLVASFSVVGRPHVRDAPAGWTSLLPRRLVAGGRTRLFAFVHVVTASDATTTTWSWRLSGRRTWSGGMARYMGVDPDHPVDSSASVTSTDSARSTIVVPSVRTTTNGAMLIGGLGARAGRLAVTPPPGWAEVWDTRGDGSGHAYRRQRRAGATGELTWTVSSARPLAAWVAALRPEDRTPAPPSPDGGAPTASFTVEPGTGTVPLSLTFTDTSTGSPTSWSWDFGDGTTASTAQNPSHTYVAAGSYTVSLRTTNASGSDTVTRPAAVTVAAPAPSVLVGAGDIADCILTADSATGALLDATPGTVFARGDNAYPEGTTSDYANCYDPAWGAVKDRTRPVVGNHDYLTSSSAAPYFDYFGAAAGEAGKGWYSYDVGTDWHVVVLNSNCTIVAGGCAAGSPQEEWLRADLAASARPCTMAMWHHPRFSSGEHGNDSSTAAFWEALYADGAELVLNGHDHDYERFAPQDPSAVDDPTYGIRELVVGTGGQELRPFGSVAANSEVRSFAAHGVLKLSLNSGSYDWSFLPIPGDSLVESGTGTCHGPPA